MEDGMSAYEISVEEAEVVMKIRSGGGSVVCHFKVNQAFAFMALFISQLSFLASSLAPEGDMRSFYVLPTKKGGGGGEQEGGLPPGDSLH